MVKQVVLNDSVIKTTTYQEERENGLTKITFGFKVTSEEYHDVTTLLYKGTFEVKVPARDLAFRGTIQQYSTSVDNLYEQGQVGDFQLTLLEMKEGQG